MLRAVSIQLTDACNLACGYCYFAHKAPRAMDPATIEATLAFCLANADPAAPRFGVNFFGGEPFLAAESMDRLATVLSRGFAKHHPHLALRFSTTTNGTLFDARALELVQRHRIHVQLSLDGQGHAHDRYRRYRNGRGSFERIERNLPLLKQAPGFGVRMTVTPETVEALPDGIGYLLDSGVMRIAVAPVSEEEWSEAALEAFARAWRRVTARCLIEQQAGAQPRLRMAAADQAAIEEEAGRIGREFGCGAAVHFAFIDHNGAIYPCQRYPGYFDRSPAVRIGSVFEGLDPLQRSRFIAANRCAAKRACAAFVPREKALSDSRYCRDCLVSGSCGGSCFALNHFVTGDPVRPPATPGRIRQIMLAVKWQTEDFEEMHPSSKELVDV
jgi:uncharacterized protein